MTRASTPTPTPTPTPLQQIKQCPTALKTTRCTSRRCHHMMTGSTSVWPSIKPGNIKVPRLSFWWTVSVSLQNDPSSHRIVLYDLGLLFKVSVGLIVLWWSSFPVLADGPLSVTISGPDSVLVGTIVTLECSASSRPTCDFYWHVNTQEFALTTGPKISFPATKMHQGTYTCVAKNPVTNISLPQSKMVVVGEWAVLDTSDVFFLAISE